MKESTHFIKATDKIQVELPDHRLIEGPRGGTVEEFLQPLVPELKHKMTAAIVNKELRELSLSLKSNACVAPVTTNESAGKDIYRRSLVFLLSATFEKLFPNLELMVDHSIQTGGLFCRVKGASIKNNLELCKKLESEMKSLVAQNIPIERTEIPIEKARSLFMEKRQFEKVHLLKYRTKEYLTLYRLNDFSDYHYGYMVPSTRYLSIFAIEPAANSNEFFLRYPRYGDSTELLKLNEDQKMMNEFREYGAWLQRLGIGSIASLNDAIEKERIQEVILVSEALHSQKFAQLAQRIVERKPKVRVVLIAGPSSSGKTTFSKRLSIELLAAGVSPVPIEMDNFFVDRVKSPRDENGNYDFESIQSLDLPLMDSCIQRLLDGEEVQFPHYDFLDGKSKPGKMMKIKKDQLLIIEGIHGLNPHLLQAIDPDQKFKIFASPFTQLNVDRYNRVSTVDTRLLRRIVRDYRDRGYSAQDTIARWGSVRSGEEKYIFPFQGLADEYCNTSLVYELSALKPLAESVLRQVPWGCWENIEAKRLLAFLDWVLPLPLDLVPANSILAEFIGGSNLKKFSVWKEH